MILEHVIARERKLWDELDMLSRVRAEHAVTLKDLQITLEKLKALTKVHKQNMAEIKSASVVNLSEYRSIREGFKRLAAMVKETLTKAEELVEESKKVSKEIKAKQAKLDQLQVQAEELRAGGKILRFKEADEN